LYLREWPLIVNLDNTTGRKLYCVIFYCQLLIIAVIVLSVLIITVIYCHFYCQCCELLSFTTCLLLSVLRFTVLVLSLLRITVIYFPYRSSRASTGIAPLADYI
jgi:hypothetical protein